MSVDTYLKAAREVVDNDVVVESDGFMWGVLSAAYNSKRVALTLRPVYPSITAREDRIVVLRASASVRVAV